MMAWSYWPWVIDTAEIAEMDALNTLVARAMSMALGIMRNGLVVLALMVEVAEIAEMVRVLVADFSGWQGPGRDGWPWLMVDVAEITEI